MDPRVELARQEPAEAAPTLFSFVYFPDDRKRHFVLYFDGLRYSFKILKLVSARMMSTLDDVVKYRASGQSTEELVVSALSDGWAIIDMTHRIRMLLPQMPCLSNKRPEIQIFLKSTA